MASKRSAAEIEDEVTVGAKLHEVLKQAAVRSGKPLMKIEEEADLPSGWLSKQTKGQLSCVAVMKAARILNVSIDDLMGLLDDPEATVLVVGSPRAARAVESAIDEKAKQGSPPDKS